MCRKPPWGSKRRGRHPIIGDAKTPIGLCGGIHLSKMLRMNAGEGPRTGQIWKKTQDNWPKVNQHPEGLSYISDLNYLDRKSVV